MKISAVSLKYPATLADGTRFTAFIAGSKSTYPGGTEYLVEKVLRNGKFVAVVEQILHVQEDCVVSRQYLDQFPKPKQLELNL